jgi:hypothetical protein
MRIPSQTCCSSGTFLSLPHGRSTNCLTRCYSLLLHHSREKPSSSHPSQSHPVPLHSLIMASRLLTDEDYKRALQTLDAIPRTRTQEQYPQVIRNLFLPHVIARTHTELDLLGVHFSELAYGRACGEETATSGIAQSNTLCLTVICNCTSEIWVALSVRDGMVHYDVFREEGRSSTEEAWKAFVDAVRAEGENAVRENM